jgi:hypothetical protein
MLPQVLFRPTLKLERSLYALATRNHFFFTLLPLAKRRGYDKNDLYDQRVQSLGLMSFMS